MYRVDGQKERLKSSSVSRAVDILARHHELPLLAAHGTTWISNSDKSQSRSSTRRIPPGREAGYASTWFPTRVQLWNSILSVAGYSLEWGSAEEGVALPCRSMSALIGSRQRTTKINLAEIGLGPV